MMNNKINYLLSDEAILAELGKRIAQCRIERQFTQVQLAEQAGVSKSTIERIEAGASAQMSSMIRVFRILDLLPGLEQLIPETGPRPMDLLKLQGKKRQRAYKKRRVENKAVQKWSWGDDT